MNLCFFFEGTGRGVAGKITNVTRFVETDSRLGWEPSMEYCGGPEQIRWKLGLMERLYGFP